MSPKSGMADDVSDSSGSAIDRHAGRSVFGRKADTYDVARSGYPPALAARIAGHCAPHPAVFEIGAGTGLSTDLLLGLEPRRLVVLEPDRGMAEVLQRRLAGTGAQIVCEPFPDRTVSGPFDLVACAAAFHWLEVEPALRRIAELLAPDGLLAVWWNSYFGHGQPDPFGDRLSALFAERGIELPPSYVDRRHYAFDTEHHQRAFAAGGFAVIEHAVLLSQRSFTPEQARDLYATFSFIELLGEAERGDILDRIAEIVRDEFGGEARGVCATGLYLCRRGEARR